jgi:hypothetical protein
MPDTRARRGKHAQETRPEPEPEPKPEPPRRSQVNPAGGCRARPRSGSAVWTGFWRRQARVRPRGSRGSVWRRSGSEGGRGERQSLSGGAGCYRGRGAMGKRLAVL